MAPDFTQALYQKALVFRDKGNTDAALASLRKAIEIKPNFFEAYQGIANILVQNDQPLLALESVNQAIKLKPDFANAHYNLGCILKDLDRLKEKYSSTQAALNELFNFQSWRRKISRIT